MRRWLIPLLVAMSAPGCTGLTAFNGETGEIVGPDESDEALPDDTVDTVETDAAPNRAPTADAGVDVSAIVGETVTLDGTASSDSDGDTLGFQWRLVSQPARSTTKIINDRRSTPTMWVDQEGEYRVAVVVDDGEFDDEDEVIVTVTSPNGAPVADAGADQAVTTGDTVQLNGSASFDPEGDTLRFSWQILTKPTGSTASLSDPASVLPRFVADQPGAYELQLKVNDGTDTSPADVVRVTAQSADDGDCLSCSAEAKKQMRARWTTGDVAAGPGLVLLPLIVVAFSRRKRR
jgi:hypothetical protein